MQKAPAVLFLLIVLLIGLSSFSLFAQSTVEIDTGDVRVINALVGIGAVDVYLDGERVEMGLSPEQASIYYTVPAGRHRLAVRLPNADPFSAPIADTLVDLSPNNSQSVIAYQRAFASEGYVPQLAQSGAMLVVNDNRTPLQLGKTRLTAAHLAPGTPDRLNVAYTSRASLLHEISLEQPYGTIDIDAGEYSLTVVDAASPNLDILGRLPLNFYGNTLYTLVIVPDIAPTLTQSGGVQVGTLSARPRLFAVPAPVDPPPDGLRLRIVHAAHDTQVVDIYLDERLVAQRVNYSRYTEYLGLADYSHRIALRRYGDAADAAPLAQAEFTITEDNRNQLNWTLLLLNASDDNSTALTLISPAGSPNQPNTIINTPGGSMIMVLVPDNISQTRANYARVRLLHALDGAAELSLMAPVLPPVPLPPNVTPSPTPRIPVGVTPTPLPPVTLVNPVIFGSEANEQEVPAGLYTELNIVAGASLRIETLPQEELVSGLVYTFVVIGSPSGNPPIQVLQFADYGRGLPTGRLYLGVISITTSPSANVRRLPSTNAAVIARLANGSEVEVLGRNANGQWIRIRFTEADTGNIIEGWVSASLIRITRLGQPINVLTLPTVEPTGQ